MEQEQTREFGWIVITTIAGVAGFILLTIYLSLPQAGRDINSSVFLMVLLIILLFISYGGISLYDAHLRATGRQTSRIGWIVLITFVIIIIVAGYLIQAIRLSLLHAYGEDITGDVSGSRFLIALTFIAAIVMFWGSAVYHSFLKSTGQRSILPDEVQLRDLVETTLNVDLPYPQAFDLCKHSIYFLTGGSISSADEGTGVIRGWVLGLDPDEVGVSNVTLTVEKRGEPASRIHILFITPRPVTSGRGYSPINNLLVFHYHVFPSPNEVNVQEVCDFLVRYATRAEGSPMAEPGNVPGEDSRGRIRGGDPSSPGQGSPQQFTIDGEDPFTVYPNASASLSMIIPGLGQSCQGRYDMGILVAVGACGGLMVAIVPGIVVWIYGIYEAYFTALKINEGTVPFRPPSVWGNIATVGLAVAFFAVSCLFIVNFGPMGILSLIQK